MAIQLALDFDDSHMPPEPIEASYDEIDMRPPEPMEASDDDMMDVDFVISADLVRNHAAPNIDIDNFAQPALLLTCRQIRHEASLAHYRTNKFRVVMRELDINMLMTWFYQSGRIWWSNFRDWDSFKQSSIHIQAVSTTCAPWEDAFVWLQAFYDDQASRPVCLEDCTSGGCCAVTGLFDIVSQYSDSMGWEELVPLLEIHKRSAGQGG